jgi:pSer/pThr/pTyr-binding forkhead associated (FHA) protein
MDELTTSPRAATAPELKAQIDAEREGAPFLVFRNGEGEHTIRSLAGEDQRIAVGRSTEAGIALPWDGEVSRIHAELRQIGSEWTLLDDGLSLNGSFVNGTAVRGHRRLHDGDTLRFGNTAILFRDPSEASLRSTLPSGDRALVRLSEAQTRVLRALCRPYKEASAFVTPATNQEIAAELYLSVDAVKKHMRALYERFGVEQLPQYEKRNRLVERAFAAGLVSEHDL